jgi:hypothetical protein
MKTLAKELHKPIRKKFKRRKVIVHHIDHIWSADLVILPLDKGYKYLLTVIDVFSKYAWGIPLKNKTGLSLVDAFQKIFKQTTRRPKKLWCDKGKEFFNRNFKNFLKDNNIHLYSTESEIKGSVIERFNRTVEEPLYRKFTENGNKKWINIIDNIINKYNNTEHSTIKMKPIEVNQSNESEIFDRVFKEPVNIKGKQKFKIGDSVRIYKFKGTFAKGYEKNWTLEVFKVAQIHPSFPITYSLKDENDEEIIGKFNSEQLQKSDS